MNTLSNVCGPVEVGVSSLKLEVMSAWIESQWMPRFPDLELRTYYIATTCVDEGALGKFVPDFELPGGFRFVGVTPIECNAVASISSYDYDGELSHRTGAFTYRFQTAETNETVDVLVMASHYTDEGWRIVAVGCMPEAFQPVWTVFARECNRLAYALTPDNEVVVIGGNSNSFVPKVDWDDVVLPAALKHDLMEDVRSFFTKGIDVYRRLNLKPFRKLLLAGVPGTGKTMICSAIAKWALAQNYVVIYVSSARKGPSDPYGSTFAKIEHALSVAADSALPALILLEELDAYLHPEEKALVLNVLDGSESSINDKGTLLISTTNYPEAIDERILKRPGRLDRIFIIPETRAQADAEQMLRQYLGVMWHDDHKELVPELVGYPGAFIREVAVYALTQLAYDDGQELSMDLLRRSFKGLKEQIDARDDFLKKRGPITLVPTNGNGSKLPI
ncbi:MAG: ATP-binding protein [Anaerolineae bacterium]|nr:ATP-binding protein [Anaerolineae bacterium]